MNQYIIEACRANNFEQIERPYPFKFGEDFGWFSKRYKTAMFGIGARIDSPALHHANYDFPDELLDTGMSMFKSIILFCLEKGQRANHYSPITT